jgi:hypothetical protein
MKDKGGRPTKMTPETVKKLEEAFLMGCSDLEACLFADISKQTLYTYQEKHPEFSDRKKILKENPVMEARKSVLRDMKKDGNLALKYLERKRKAEFSVKQEYEHSTSSDKPLKWDITYHKADVENKD